MSIKTGDENIGTAGNCGQSDLEILCEDGTEFILNLDDINRYEDLCFAADDVGASAAVNAYIRLCRTLNGYMADALSELTTG